MVVFWRVREWMFGVNGCLVVVVVEVAAIS
jgi:hypothetical protein